MSTLSDVGILQLTTIPLLLLALLARRKLLAAHPNWAGGVVVLAAIVGGSLGAYVLHVKSESAEQQRMNGVVDHLTDAECARPVAGSGQDRDLHELLCARDKQFATLTAGAVHVDADVAGDLFAAPLPHVPAVAGKTYVLWLLDAGGAVVAHVALAADKPVSYMRDAKVPTGVAAELTLETAIGTKPAGEVIARAPLTR